MLSSYAFNTHIYALSFRKPYKEVSKATIARWLKTVLRSSGIDVEKYKAHSICPAAASKAYGKSTPIQIIMQTGGWTKESTFSKFYQKKIVENVFQNNVLSINRK